MDRFWGRVSGPKPCGMQSKAVEEMTNEGEGKGGSDLTVMDIIERAGGLLELSHRYQITTNAMRLWASRGIPRRYHRDLSGLARLSVEAIREVSLRAKAVRLAGVPGDGD